MTNNSRKPAPLSAAEILLGLSGDSSPAPRPLNKFSSPPQNILGLLGESYRRRNEWNTRFQHWERPASVTEEGTIERAERNVRLALADNHWLNDEGVVIRPQGSYHNNTNVRVEADIDLRAVHPAAKVEYHENVVQSAARDILRYASAGLTDAQVFSRMRSELFANLGRKFGYLNVDIGRKALRIKGITGSRAEVDVVPVVNYHFVQWNSALNRYSLFEGVAIYSTDGRWTINFPEQHYANGVAKNDRTSRRFKRIVRIFKRLRADMELRGLLLIEVPSFLVECLVYAVEDEYFLVESDDAYHRVLRVARQMKALLESEATAAHLTEVNEIKILFHVNQSWGRETATAFVSAVLTHLGEI